MNYDFAYNRTKLAQAVNHLNSMKLINPTIEITEEVVRAEYIKRGGLIVEKAGKSGAETVDNQVGVPAAAPAKARVPKRKN